jgi:hypothetical protein
MDHGRQHRQALYRELVVALIEVLAENADGPCAQLTVRFSRKSICDGLVPLTQLKQTVQRKQPEPT